MSESCDPSWNFSISEFVSFVSSHFIYFSYLIFFAPYLFRIVSFLSPLFLTTSLLSLAFLNFYYSFVEKLRRGKAHRNEEILQRCDDLEMYEAFFGAVEFEENSEGLVKLEGKSEDLEVNSISGEKSEMEEKCEKIHRNEEIQSFVDLGMYETLFGSNLMEKPEELVKWEEKSEDLDFAVGEKVEVNSISGEKSEMEEKCKKIHRNEGIQRFVDLGMYERESTAEFEEKPEELVKSEANSNSGQKSEMEEKRMENFLKILDEFEKMASNVDGRKKPGSKPDKAVEKPLSLSISNGSDAINGAKSKSHSQRIAPPRADEEREIEGGERKPSLKLKAESSRALMAVNSYGSMRREKEWKRTLACKLFEERHNNADGGEGMDSLWETYEIDSTKNETKTKSKSRTKTKKIDVEFIEEEDDDDGDEVAAPLCCLQALKLSTRKMNLGVGIPSLVKISKAIKGMGWLHSVSKHSKKVHNNNGDRY